MKRIDTELKNGILELVVLNNGRLILGEYKGEKTYTYELQKALKRSGIINGYLNNCLNLIESGTAGQIPVAQAFIEDEPGELEFHFEKKLERAEIIDLLKTKNFGSLNLFHDVKKGDLLVSLLKTSSIVLKYPNGSNEVLQKLDSSNMEYYKGKNVSVDVEEKALFSKIDGLAQRDLFGTVSVFPQAQVKSIGKAHGRVSYDSALGVEQDIRSESDVYSAAGIYVGGMTRSSRIEAGGSIYVNYGFDNPKQSDLGYAVAGQSIFASAIRNYHIRAAFYIISNTVIENSSVSCLSTIITPRIKSSEIKVGNKLFVNEIEGNSQIYLGPYFTKDPKYDETKNFHQQHIKRQYDLESETRIIIDKIRHEQRIALIQLQKLKKVSSDNIHGDVLLNRYYQNLISLNAEMEGSIKKYERQMHLINKERIRMAYYERQFFNEANAEIICLGALEEGTIITAPNETIKMETSRKNVSIKLDSVTGKVVFYDL